jgi:radical SAM superfamily enzyme YgiQ (UPF0313 family)
MRIALVAMSGVRTCNMELLELGLTLPGFVERSKVVASLPSLGLLTLAGMTPDHHELSYHEIEDIRSFNDDSIFDDCDLIAISSYSAQINEAYELSAHLRSNGKQVVLGGIHVSACPEEALEHCSSVVVGEGEPCWSQLIENAERGELRRVYKNSGEEFDLADAPIPRFDLLEISKYNRLTVQTSRGCPHRCDFCAGSILLTKKYKQKPLDKVLAEIDRILELWPKAFIEFADDNSFINRSYWKELLPELAKRKIRWFTETDISIADDPELLKLMQESGCAQVLIGLETPNSAELEGIEQKSNWKYKQSSKYLDAIQTIQSHRITVNGCFILGLEGQTSEVFDRVYNFVEKSGLFEVQITLLTPFPGTPLYLKLNQEDRLIEPLNWKKCTLFDVNFKPSSMSVRELEKGFMQLGQKLYNQEFTDLRRRKFFQSQKPKVQK